MTKTTIWSPFIVVVAIVVVTSKSNNYCVYSQDVTAPASSPAQTPNFGYLPCSICNTDETITQPSTLIPAGTISSLTNDVTCIELESSMQSAIFSPFQCAQIIRSDIPDLCGCLEVSATPIPIPVEVPIIAPVAVPITTPVAVPITTPVAVPITAPVAAPITAPVAVPIAAPVAVPITAPVEVPIAPIGTPVTVPVAAPVVAVPTPVPVAMPIVAPSVVAPVTTPIAIQPVTAPVPVQLPTVIAAPSAVPTIPTPTTIGSSDTGQVIVRLIAVVDIIPESIIDEYNTVLTEFFREHLNEGMINDENDDSNIIATMINQTLWNNNATTTGTTNRRKKKQRSRQRALSTAIKQTLPHQQQYRKLQGNNTNSVSTTTTTTNVYPLDTLVNVTYQFNVNNSSNITLTNENLVDAVVDNSNDLVQALNNMESFSSRFFFQTVQTVNGFDPTSPAPAPGPNSPVQSPTSDGNTDDEDEEDDDGLTTIVAYIIVIAVVTVVLLGPTLYLIMSLSDDKRDDNNIFPNKSFNKSTTTTTTTTATTTPPSTSAEKKLTPAVTGTGSATNGPVNSTTSATSQPPLRKGDNGVVMETKTVASIKGYDGEEAKLEIGEDDDAFELVVDTGNLDHEPPIVSSEFMRRETEIVSNK